MTGYTHKLGKTYTSDMGAIATTTQSFTGSAQTGCDEDVPATTTNQRIPLPITKTKIVSMTIYSSAVDVTVKTNSNTAPQETLVIPAGSQLEWDTTSPNVCPFSANITDLYVTNAGAKTTRFRCEVLLVD